jgi:hypothetical protein
LERTARRIASSAWRGLIILTDLASTALFLLASLAGFAAGRTADDLKDVRKVYVGSLGHEQAAEQLRKDVISQLKKSGLVEVVSSPREADAVLTGAAELWIRGYYSLNPRSGIMPQNGTPVFGGSLSVELEGRGDDTLWSYLATPHFGSTDIGKDLCKELVRQLTQALQDAGRPASETKRH